MRPVSFDDVKEQFERPLPELLFHAQTLHRQNFDPLKVQASTLLSIKTGGCPENCAYCPQSAHYKTGLQKEPLLSCEEVVQKARQAKQNGATRFCMGAAWREVKDGPDFDRVLAMVRAVKDENLEVCCTLGMLNAKQAQRLKEAGLYAYNHNIDTSRSYYSRVISTRSFDDRLQTIANVRAAGLTVCTGGILGMGESRQDRMEFLLELVHLDPQPESVTINTLVPMEGTPLAEQSPVDIFEVVRVIAVARIFMPQSMIRLSAGRLRLSDEGHLLCLMAGANSIFLGEKLLTSANPDENRDRALFAKLGVVAGENPRHEMCQ